MDFIKIEGNVSKEPNLEDFWKLETIGIKESATTSDDEKAILEFNKLIKLDNERYQACCPWREENTHLPDNCNLTYERLNKLRG